MIYSLNPSLKTSLEWKVIVEDYSSRDLMFADDKLPALAGLAQKFQKETKYTYVAGLWLETLAWDLLWTVRAVFFVNEKPKYPKAAARLHSAPSWSWASVDCMVDLQEPKETYRIADMTHHSFVLDVEGLPPGNDSFGHVRRAILNVECEVLIPVRPAERSSSGTLHRPFHYTRVNDMKRFAFFANLDYKYVTNGVKYLLPLYTLIESSSDGKYRDGAYTLSEPKGTQIVVGGLILEQIGQWYRRIGTFRPNFRWQENVKDWIQLTKTFIPDLRETDYERRYIDEKTGHERCTIKII
jgi:hypothetical protein